MMNKIRNGEIAVFFLLQYYVFISHIILYNMIAILFSIWYNIYNYNIGE